MEEKIYFGNKVEYILEAKYALFSNPLLSIGGEKCSYQVPTYEAILRITENIYWKPTFKWIIDSVTVLNPIDYETKAMKTRTKMDMKDNDLAYYTFLKNVKYLIKAHFEWNENFPQFKEDREVKKHKEIFERSLKKGGRLRIFAGISECPAYVYPITKISESYYNSIDIYPIGYMYHSKGYPNENKDGEEKMFVYLSNILMKKGVINYPKIEECDKRIIKDMSFYNFENKETKDEEVNK